MLIDERIGELSEQGAKELLRRAVEEIAAGIACKNCAMRLVCGSEASEDDCMCRVLTLLAVPDAKEAEGEKPDEEGTVYYDPETMRIVG